MRIPGKSSCSRRHDPKVKVTIIKYRKPFFITPATSFLKGLKYAPTYRLLLARAFASFALPCLVSSKCIMKRNNGFSN